MNRITDNDIVQLMVRFSGAARVVSCYADLTVSEGFRRHWEPPLKSEAARIRGGAADDEAAQNEFRRNVEAARAALSGDEAHRHNGAAVFVGEAGRTVRTFWLEAPPADRLVDDFRPYIVPLAEAIRRQQVFLAALADGRTARLYAAGAGEPEFLSEIAGDVPRDLGSTGRRWSSDAGGLDGRHREHLGRFQKQTAEAIARRFADDDFAGIALIGPHEFLKAVRDRLPGKAAEAVVHEAPHAGRLEDTRIADIVRPVREAAAESRRRRLLELVGAREAGGFRVCDGPQEVIEALRHGQAARLVFSADRRDSGCRCMACGSIFARKADDCPHCGNRCESVDLRQETVLWAIRHRVPFDFVGACDELDRRGGVVALLNRDDMYKTQTPPAGSAQAASTR
jgi:hypothetical protein